MTRFLTFALAYAAYALLYSYIFSDLMCCSIVNDLAKIKRPFFFFNLGTSTFAACGLFPFGFDSVSIDLGLTRHNFGTRRGVTFEPVLDTN